MDIREKGEEASEPVQASEAKFIMAFRSIPDAIIITTLPDGEVVEVNEGFCILTGYTLDEAVGCTTIELDIWAKVEQREQFLEHIDQEGRVTNLECDLRTRTGAIVSTLVSAERIELEGRPHLLSVMRDITERRRVQQSIRESEARFQALLHSLDDVVWAADPDGGKLRYINRSAEVVYGCSLQYMMENVDFWKELVHPEDRERVLRVSETLLEAGEVELEYRIVRPDGEVRWLLDRKHVLYDDEGQPEQIGGITSDITERKETEATVRGAQQALLRQREQEKERAEAELARLKDQLVRQTRLATIGQMAASIAHELRNPLGTVRNAVYYLKRRVPDDQPKWNEYLTIVEQEVGSANRIISDLLEMSHSKQPLKEAVDLKQLAEDAFARVPGRSTVGFTVDCEASMALIHADAAQLLQVLVNLFTNAVQAMEGHGAITVESRRGQDGFAMIIVRDNGPGVAPEVRQDIFEPLFTTKAKGTGLGLAICQQILQQHGGALELLDEEKGGAAFCLLLPVEAGTHETQAVSNEPGKPSNLAES